MNRRLLTFVLAASLSGAAVTVATGIHSRARADSPLLGWTAQADANTVDLVFDNTAGLAGNHPLVEADLPEDEADFESGPFGYALATVFWPGSVAGNVGSLSGELGAPSQLAPLLGQLNDPVRAETYVPSGPADATYPSGGASGVAEMVSHSDDNGTWARAGITDLTESSLLSIQNVQGYSKTAATSTAQATSTGSFSGASLLGGLVTIGASSSTASATSDGIGPSGSSTSHIGAVKVLGQALSAGSDGVIVGPGTISGLAAVTDPTSQLIQQLASLIQLKIKVLPQTETSKAPAEQITSGGLQVSFALPANLDANLNCSALNALGPLSQLSVLCTLPGLLQGASVTLTLDRVTAEAIATPPFGSSLPGSSVSTPPLPVSGSSPSLGNPSASLPAAISTPSGAAVSASGPALAGNPTPVAQSGSPPTTAAALPSAPTNLVSASLSSPVRAGLVFFLLVLAGLAGGALVRMVKTIDAPLPMPCPLEDA
ncbi:MAG TPA: hypothetical protein VG435_17405 [Acidimicrobiales bacterium]|nr:hypothetical protein [Acidimicrobiales bacterium]